MTPLHRTSKAVLTAAATTAILLTAACGSDSEPADDPGSGATSSPSADAGEDAPAGDYADGTYAAEGSYTNPGGTSSVEVELTLEGGSVSDVTVTPQASGTSRQYQEKFVSGIEDVVVGKKLDELDVDKVAGSSLTAGGFNEAVAAIKADAGA